MNKKWLIVIIAGLVGGFPDYAKLLAGENWNSWNGLYKVFHEIVWYNFIFFLHTLPDLPVHDPIIGGWTILAWIIEISFWGLLLIGIGVYFYIKKEMDR